MKRLVSPLMPIVVVAMFAVLTLAVPSAFAVDEERAMATLKDNGCMKCHAISRRKKGPSYNEVARKYANKPNAPEILYKHLTGAPIVKLEDGDEEHSTPKTNDRGEIDNVIMFILLGKRE